WQPRPTTVRCRCAHPSPARALLERRVPSAPALGQARLVSAGSSARVSSARVRQHGPGAQERRKGEGTDPMSSSWTRKIVLYTVVGLILIAFIVFYGGPATRSGSRDAGAKVQGEEIPLEVFRVYRRGQSEQEE